MVDDCTANSLCDGDCQWQIPTPECTPSPTMYSRTNDALKTVPTQRYLHVIVIEHLVNHDKKWELNDRGIEYDTWKYCYNWDVYQVVDGKMGPKTCKAELYDIVLGVCKDPDFDLNRILINQTVVGCDNIYDYYDPDLDVHGLRCSIAFDTDFDPTDGFEEETITMTTIPVKHYGK